MLKQIIDFKTCARGMFLPHETIPNKFYVTDNTSINLEGFSTEKIPEDVLIANIIKHFIKSAEDIHNLNSFSYHESARTVISNRQIKFMIFIMLVICLIGIINYDYVLYGIYFLINLILFLDLIFKIVIFTRSLILPTVEHDSALLEAELPIYTVLVPVYKESNMIKNINNSLSGLDYPKDKLDILVLLEEDDLDTITAVEKDLTIKHRKVVLPKVGPKTKPKAMLIAMYFAKGEFLTIFDAEDTPDKDQLRKVIKVFKSDNSGRLACVQARLNMTNYFDSMLSMFFSLEYNIWFNHYIKGLFLYSLPVPLGGTSNHFRMDILHLVSGWDPYNVTEDADLGMRLYKKGYITGILDSETKEIAPTKLSTWIGQRSRWIKGYYQTFLVHNRNIHYSISNFGMKNFIGFNLFIAVQVLAFTFLLPMILISIVCYFTNFDFKVPLVAWLNIGLNFIVQMCFALYVYSARNYKNRLIYCFIYPFYFILHSIASYKAIIELIVKPFYWFRTPH